MEVTVVLTLKCEASEQAEADFLLDPATQQAGIGFVADVYDTVNGVVCSINSINGLSAREILAQIQME
jgi:hypothetical protein